MTQYALPGDKKYQEQLYPNPSFLDRGTGLKTYEDVIAHFTASSLAEDGIQYRKDSLSVTKGTGAAGYTVSFEPLPQFAKHAEHFKKMHIAMLDAKHAGLALKGVDACKETSAWNPMAGYRVNRNPTDGPSEWFLYLPLGMPIANHRAVTLLHYPPLAAYRKADYLKSVTMRRWVQLLKCGMPNDRPELYHLIIDVNPIAAPGSGESEYPNDYFPVNLTSLFFDNDKEGLTYVRSMLDLMLNPPANKGNPYTLPLLVGGSPDYDPQAPGWFRARYKEHLPQNEFGMPMADVLQAGLIKINPDSKPTPYMIANHMIAAGVMGRWTGPTDTPYDPYAIPNIQKYEAQDLVAATFLSMYKQGEEINPAEAKEKACRRWFGAPDGNHAPNPQADQDRLTICALAQMDRCFDPVKIGPRYTYEEAIARCQLKGGPDYSPCFGCDPFTVNEGIALPWEDTSMGLRPALGDYLICRSKRVDDYSVWRVDINGEELLQRLPGDAEPGTSHHRGREHMGAQFDRTHQLISIGNYVLEWGPLTLQSYTDPTKPRGVFPYRLFWFDASSKNPLDAKPVMNGFWEKKKFFGSRPDIGNPEGAAKAYDTGELLMLVPLGSFILNVIPTVGRGTFLLFNFDPGSKDPLPMPPNYIGGSFDNIQFGHELIPLGNYVLDRLVDPHLPLDETHEYWLWSFDPKDKMPLARPTIQKGHWNDIDRHHQLIPIGEYVLDWDMRHGSYRLWRFDPKSPNPLTGPKGKPVRSGSMPKEFDAETTTLTSIQGLRPIDQARKDRPGTIDFMRTKIKHVVYLMIENRSFDHVCGWLYEKGEEGINFVGPDGPFKGAKYDMYNVDPNVTGKPKVPVDKYHKGDLSEDVRLGFLTDDPYHDHTDVMRQYFRVNRNGYANRAKPDMDGFVWNQQDHNVMLTYTPEQLPVLNGLAKAFAVSDEWFCSTPDETTPNRAFALTGSTLGKLGNFQNNPEFKNWSETSQRASIWKVLWANGFKDWKIYNSILWPPDQPSWIYTYQLFLRGQIPTVDADASNYPAKPSHYIASIEQFKDDAWKGKLPRFSFLEPAWIGGVVPATSYHPAGHSPVPAERALNEIYEALKAGPAWNETLFIITFDEHGGMYDHVPPPYAENPWPNDVNDGFKFDLMGARVPAILVSPWIEEQTVFRSRTPVAYDSTSILATLLSWYGIPRACWGMGERTHHAPTFEGVFQCESPRGDAPSFEPPYDMDYPRKGKGGAITP